LHHLNLLCHAYCLMTNHFPLLLETPNANQSKAMCQHKNPSIYFSSKTMLVP